MFCADIDIVALNLGTRSQGKCSEQGNDRGDGDAMYFQKRSSLRDGAA